MSSIKLSKILKYVTYSQVLIINKDIVNIHGDTYINFIVGKLSALPTGSILFVIVKTKPEVILGILFADFAPTRS